MTILQKLGQFCTYAVILLLPVIVLLKLEKIEAKLIQPKIIYYQVDSFGGSWDGKVIRKQRTDEGYVLEVRSHGQTLRFVVTEEQYDRTLVGENAPEFLKKKGG